MNIALIEDNENLRESVRAYLELEGYRVIEFDDLPDVQDLTEAVPDCVILDIMLPSGNGLLLGKQFRQLSRAPLIFLTARVSESDRITGLELGADDYVTKPFSPRELVLRVNALMRRWRSDDSEEDASATVSPERDGGAQSTEAADARRYVLASHSLLISPGDHRISADEEDVKLTAAEWNILDFISRRPGQIFTRMQLLEQCLDSFAEGSERTVDTHIKNLRQKLGLADWIETERGFGYRFAGNAKS
jgi:DNA-binding response OmpR family regulator